MKIRPRRLVTPLIAMALFAVTVQQTGSALRASGTWSAITAEGVAPDPYARLDGILARRDTTKLTPRRDPFTYGRVAAPVAVHRPATPRPTEPAAPVARPVLKAIIWDADPRASVYWNDRDYSVRVNTLFDDYRVRSITRDQIVLERAGESIVLRLPQKGE